jgi:hypothetical protein
MEPMTTSTADPTAIPREASLGMTETLEPMTTTSSLRKLTVTSGLRTLHEVLWGDALFDKYTYRQLQNLAKQGATPAPGNAVDVRE